MDYKNGKENVLRLLILIAENPFFYTKKGLSRKMNDMSVSTIDDYFRDIRNVGFVLDCDRQYRYGFKVEGHFEHIQNLLLFTKEDRGLLAHTIDQIEKGKRGESLKRKLNGLYDFKKLGHEFLRTPYLKKLDRLQEAKGNKLLVVLEDYTSSNSNTISNRVVEPFHIDPEADMLHSFDVKSKKVRHFRISRFKRVQILDMKWESRIEHPVAKTDPFRIVHNNQVPVHIRFNIAARNELLERFPLTRQYIMEAEEKGFFDLQCSVNSKFYGLGNFIIGFHHWNIEVLSPDSLIDHLNERVEKMKF
ncbi:MAG: helix-turn-helix transcriptional regulator [Saprospiraceae bacterium]